MGRIMCRMIYAVFLVVLASCTTVSPIQLTGLSGEQSPFLIHVRVLFNENTSGIPEKSSFVIYPTNLKDKSTFRCKTNRNAKEYLFSISREGPADKANSFFFSFWSRKTPYDGTSYMLWKGYLPDPKRYYAFTEIVQNSSEGRTTLMIVITNFILENEENQRSVLEYINSESKKSNVNFGCYFDDK